ncbi:macrolide ABC transporter ATP-binding protein [bacterium]|nr:macrolide ABC transporter ATP-binding protein [bacterium]
MTNVVTLDQVYKTYDLGEIKVPVLKGVDLKIKKGEWVSLMGPSGSGKTTLMNIVGLLDTPTDGNYLLNEEMVSAKNDDDLSNLRNNHIGFVFQTFNILPQLNAWQNVALPLNYSVRNQKPKKIAMELLDKVGLKERATHKPNELSGGERQRVAVARALSNSPSLILADEPTGNLDSKTGKDVLELFEQLHSEGITILMVTHDTQVAKRSQRTINILDGKIA